MDVLVPWFSFLIERELMLMALSPPWAFFLSIAFALSLSCEGDSHGDKQVYVVYMGDLPNGGHCASTIHSSMLQIAVGSQASEVLVHSYKRSFNGFAARLTEQEKELIASMDGVVTVFPSGRKQLHTTRSWDFIGFPEGVQRSTVESDIIVGMLDTGIWPESKSFQDDGYGPPPARFKGICQSVGNFTCNNKIIGAKYYRADGNFTDDVPSPRDTDGHGTHTASTAAGRQVKQASFFNLAKGTARGGVPSARIAVYKICWSDGCYDADILAAFDDAIADGVDIINLSIGGDFAVQYFNDSIAIGTFHATRNGILCSVSAGNSGPDPGTVPNVAPWQLAVAATSTDRKFVTKVKLGNHNKFEGIALNTFNLHKKQHPLVYGGDVTNPEANFTTREGSRYCTIDSLDQSKVKGKIVLCDLSSSGEGLTRAHALGTIMCDDGFKDFAYTYPLPTTYLSSEDGSKIARYINSTSKPTATIYKSTEEKEESAPFVLSFSSRGPNTITADILKPDLSAPGSVILAAYSEADTVTGFYGDTRVVQYNILSGTSMACPHVTGAAAYVKSFHPTWSPAAIRSALMTTAKPLSALANNEAEFAYGSGQIDPVKAIDPGLVYDAGPDDYTSFLCGQGIGTKHLRLITGDNSTCSKANHGKVWDLNYPSFAASANNSKSINRVFHRTVTNVGSPTSTYNAIVYSANSTLLYIKVEPEVLRFELVGQKLTFTVRVHAKIEENIVSGSLVWNDGVHQVRSPIVAHSYA